MSETVTLVRTRELLEVICRRLEAASRHQEACEVAGLAFRLSDDVLDSRKEDPWWNPDRTPRHA